MDNELDQALNDPTSPAVVARKFDETTDPTELAAWSGAEVIEVEVTNSDGEVAVQPVLEVPTPRGARPAVEGDWVVRLGEGKFVPVAADDFTARFEPLEPGEFGEES
ncbi:MAG: hypothetical protein JWM64_2686 [Frankiales bacterium]|nr:hypothetical protein [Frankiales bacterium]